MSYIDDDRMDKIAINLRKKFGIDHQFKPDMLSCIYKARAANIIKCYKRVPVSQMDDLADFDPDTGVLTVREDVWQDAYFGVPYARFTIAHEIGHAVLGHSRKRFRAALAQERQAAPKIIKVDEAQANAFASAFLIPANLVEAGPSMTVEGLSELFGVSLECARIRLPKLQRLYRIARGIKRELPPNVIDFLESFNKKPVR